jgi:UDP-2,3-diacylglucosamine hydrolase
LGQQVAAGLKRLSEKGIPAYLMVGNRDFLLGRGFAAASGATLLEDALVMDLYGMPTLLMHGDTLCTDDVAYQQFRAQVRSPEWQTNLLARPLAERRALAKQLRDGSRQATQDKPLAIMDVNSQAVIDAMEAYGVRRLIHGHTHRPAIHEWIMRGGPAQRIVLGDWYSQGSVLYYDASGCRLEPLSL